MVVSSGVAGIWQNRLWRVVGGLLRKRQNLKIRFGFFFENGICVLVGLGSCLVRPGAYLGMVEDGG